MVQSGRLWWAASLLVAAAGAAEGTGVVDMEVCRHGCSAVPQDMWPYCCESHNTCCQEFADSCVHDCLPRVNSGDVSVVEERPGLCCALYNLCCFRETPRISPKRKNDGPPPSIPIVHRFSFPTSVSQQRAPTSPAVAPAPAARPPAPRDDQPREPPRKTSPNRPQLPRKLPGRPRDFDDDQDAGPNFATGPRRPQLPRKLPFRPDDSADGPQPPRKFANRPSDSDRPQPNRPNSSDRPQFLRNTDSDEPQISNRAQGPGQQSSRKIKVRPRPQQRNDVEAERGEAEKLPAPVQTVEQEDRLGQSGAEEISVEPRGETAPLPVPPAVERTPKIISVEERPAPRQAEAVVIEPKEEPVVDDFVLLPNPLTQGQVAEPAETVTPPPAISPLDIPTYLPIEIPQDTSAPTYLPLDEGDVFEAPQLSPEEFQEAPEPSEAPVGSPQPSPSSLQEPEESQSPDPIDVPAPPAAATRERGTRTRGRARGSSSRGRETSDTSGGAVRTRSRARSQG
ncbi:pollen-specific leucine-rich repeat extensin-like protein 1 [Penaeus chinensis]|uniref:pollen-specific leucine-rich repeat extensin-like protein 1 n=1 Tax=Penaeus chinensis TaxID=139456 RepID=UPI001FB59CD7|nr:pollen-specific leucine-rich repeat extensin-like protein 1 [Penaeus chinensis]